MKAIFVVLALLGVGQSAFATGHSLLRAKCRSELGAVYHVHFWSSSAPGGPVAYHLDISSGAARVSLPVLNPRETFPNALHLVGVQRKEEQTVGHAIVYARNERAFLDIMLEGNHALNTPAPVRIKCEKN